MGQLRVEITNNRTICIPAHRFRGRPYYAPSNYARTLVRHPSQSPYFVIESNLRMDGQYGVAHF